MGFWKAPKFLVTLLKLVQNKHTLMHKYQGGRKLRGRISYQSTFVWRKLHFYGVTVKMGGTCLLAPWFRHL